MRVNRCITVLSLAFAVICIFASEIRLEAETKVIRLRNASISTPEPPKTPARQPQGLEPTVSGLYLVQCNSTLQPAWRNTLEALHIKVLRYVPDDAFIVRCNGAQLSQVRAQPFVRWMGEYRANYKVHTRLRDQLQGAVATNRVAIQVLLSPDATAQDVAAVQRSVQSLNRISHQRFGTIAQASIASSQLAGLAQSPAILWMEPAFHPKLYDEVATRIVAGDDGIQPSKPIVHQLGFTGKGVAVAVADSGIDSGDIENLHPDIAGRVDKILWYGTLTDGSDEHSHGTHCAGIVAGNGATGEIDEYNELYGLGVAPEAHIIGQRIFDGAGGYQPPESNETLTRDAIRAGAIVGSNSWGDDTQGRYDLSAAEFDALVRDGDAETPGNQEYILEFSAGNAGPGVQTIGSPAVAKNVIATGAAQNNRPDLYIYEDGQETMADFSSRGPCEDGRIKPDVTAPGTWIASLQSSAATDESAWMAISQRYQYQGGTSQAGPHVSGAAAVFVQYYRETHTNATPSPALVKAALINSAADMDASGGTAPVPNNDEGWGRVDLEALIDSDARYDFLDQTELLGVDQVFEKRVVSGSPETPLKITLVYTDVPGLPAAIPALVNDLDLEVVAPDGSVYRGNQFEAGESVPNVTATDNLNNVEAVHILRPLPGDYVIRVRARRVVEDARLDTTAIDQDFALVVSGDLPLPGVGIIAFDRSQYRADDLIKIKVIDHDLTGSTVTVALSSTSQTNALAVALTQTDVSGSYTGSVVTAGLPVTGDGRLHVGHEDTIQARYMDASPASERLASALVDLRPPVITGISSTNQFGRTTITWITDEPSSSLVVFGTNHTFSLSSTNRSLVTSHQVVLENLTVGSTIEFYAASIDAAGNASTNNNNGAYYQFVVTAAAVVLLVDAYEPDGFDFAPDIPVTTYTDALDGTGVSYDVWNVVNEGRTPTTNELSAYRVVIWRVNDSLFSTTDITAVDQTRLRAYLNGGGSLFIGSMELLSRLVKAGSSFGTDVLQVVGYDEDVGVSQAVGQDHDPVTADMNIILDYSLYPYVEIMDLGPDLSDTLTLTTNAAPIFLDANTQKPAGLRYPRTGKDSTGRLVFLSFPFDAVPLEGEAPNNRVNLLRNIISFLAPGVNGLGSLAFDAGSFTVPSKVTVEMADSDLAGQGNTDVQIFSALEPDGKTLRLQETLRPGLFRGFIAVVAATNTPAPGQLLAGEGDTIWCEYLDVSANSSIQTSATIDTQAPSIFNILAEPDYEDAAIEWETSKPCDALVQFGESKFLGRTAYLQEMSYYHQLTITGLQGDRLYYYQVVSRDAAGNVTVDDNNGVFYTLRTLKPLTTPWEDDLETGGTNWLVLDGDFSTTSWALGQPNNALATEAHSPANAWGINLDGAMIDAADTSLISPAITLLSGNKATLHFWQNYDLTGHTESDIYETAELHISTNNGVSWTLLASYADSSTFGWEEEEVDLTPYLGKLIRLGWYYGYFTMEISARPGWLVDDISITTTNLPVGTLLITNNLSQARFDISGPQIANGYGWSYALSNTMAGEYVVTFKPVPYYVTPPPQTNTLVIGRTLLFQGQYTIEDTNGNGIPDAWEQDYFGAVLIDIPGTRDFDGDGKSDYEEFISGTNPTNASSNFYLMVPVRQAADSGRVTWPSTYGYAYGLEASTNGTTWTSLMDWTRATSATMNHPFQAPTNGTILIRGLVKP